MTLKGVMDVICFILPNSVALGASCVKAAEAKPIMCAQNVAKRIYLLAMYDS